ncbi:sulfurtransferase [Actinokineospora globicatena]|uniref:sulfurtransferase n=1 Tax=Actinokineospora globicatena TaxID=103729 RepID=UPI0020A5F8B8|nr:sulfurtransferase [Actinokineospora globicatena]MCP2302611.1 thiosulfate/3-mercaptopyruvate sulfurtransferase [Actinokineospora globicatena]GLW75701.1 sulfurtransferase [Actinokineospora globicatena]GLW82542.1 sulfurtransferase [Actinokineospora globicatena]
MSANSSALVSTAELVSLLDSGHPPVLLDVRWRLGGPPGREDYAAGHLPGAVFLDLDTDLAAPPGDGGRHPLPRPDDLQAALRAAGVRTGHPVVVYDADNGSVAARAWWLLRWAGHNDVAVLDGGYAAWVADDGESSTVVPSPEPGDVEVRAGAMPVLDADEAAALAVDGVLLDARAPERYRGEVEPIDPRAGHVPGAVNAPFSGHTGPDGRWLAPTELANHFADLGVDGRPVGAYCGSGVTASSVVLALEVAGVTSPDNPAALYAGSWSHWSRDPNRPAATGDN